MLPQPAARKAALQRVLDAGAYVALLEELADSVQGAATRPSTLDGAALGAADVALVKAVFDAVDETDSHAVLEVQLASGWWWRCAVSLGSRCCVYWRCCCCQGTPYMQPLALYLIREGRVERVVAATLQASSACLAHTRQADSHTIPPRQSGLMKPWP